MRRPQPRPGLGLERSQVWAVPEKQPGWSYPLLWGWGPLLALSVVWGPGDTGGRVFCAAPPVAYWTTS